MKTRKPIAVTEDPDHAAVNRLYSRVVDAILAAIVITLALIIVHSGPVH